MSLAPLLDAAPAIPLARLRRDGRLRAGARAIRGSQGHAAASDRRLDLGRADAHGRDLLALASNAHV